MSDSLQITRLIGLLKAGVNLEDSLGQIDATAQSSLGQNLVDKTVFKGCRGSQDLVSLNVLANFFNRLL